MSTTLKSSTRNSNSSSARNSTSTPRSYKTSVDEFLISSPVSTEKMFGETDEIINSIPFDKQLAILGKFADADPRYKERISKLLKEFANEDHHLLLKFKEGKSILPINKKNKEISILNEALKLEFKKFWFEQFSKDFTDKAQQVDPKDSMVLGQLSSYVPRLVLRRILMGLSNNTPLKAPELETFPACVMFADISGFTPLTESMANLGTEGVERLSTELNRYFDSLITIIFAHGGDIIKFAGDAMLIVWPSFSDKGHQGSVLLACQCARAILDKLSNYRVPSTEPPVYLRLHIGIGAGPIGSVTVGGLYNRSEFFISGQVLEQVSGCEKQALPGEVFVSHTAWQLMKKGAVEGAQPKGSNALGNFKLEGVKTQVECPPPVTLPLVPQMDEMMRRFIPKPAIVHLNSSKWLAELRNICVVFVNLTAPFKEAKLNELQEVVVAMQKTVYKYEGTVRQFMIDDKGSVLIAGWGLPPLAHEDDAERAVLGAIGIHEALTNLGVPCSIGVTKGLCFCGDVGSSQRREYAMVGDIVNLSARLMANAKQGILTDDVIYSHAKTSQLIQFEAQPPITVKGKKNPIITYVPSRQSRVRGATKFTTSPSLRKDITSHTKVIGRTSELKLATQFIGKLKGNNEHAHCLVIEGEAGVGKTLMVEQLHQIFQSSVKKKGEATFTVVSCNQIESTTPYSGWVEVFDELLDEKGELRSNVSSLPEISLLSAVFPLKGVEEPIKYAKMNPAMKTEFTVNFLVKLLEKFIKAGSVLVFENAQWMDTPSWNLLLKAYVKLPGVFVIISTRPMPKPPIQYTNILNSHGTEVMLLKNLAEDCTSDLICQALKVKKVPKEFSRAVYEKAQGNPYFTQELMFALRDNKKIKVTSKGEIKTTENEITGVPTQLEGLITSKIDRLESDEQVIIKVAACIGTVFDIKVLKASLVGISELKTKKLRSCLKSIELAGIVVLSETDDTWKFVNSLIPASTYEKMVSDQKVQIHSNVYKYIKKKFEGNATYYGKLAHHLKAAKQYEESFYYYDKAGANALNNNAHTEASILFAAAEQLIPSLPQMVPLLDHIKLLRKSGRALSAIGNPVSALSQFVKSLELMAIPTYEQMRKKKISDYKKFVAGFIFTKDKKTANTTEHKDDLSHLQREASLIALFMAKLSLGKCDRDAAMYYSNLSIHISANLGVARAEFLGFNAVTLLYQLKLDEQVCLDTIEEARKMAGDLTDIQKNVEHSSAIVNIGLGHWTEAGDSLKKCIALAQTVGDFQTEQEATLHSVFVRVMHGEFKESTQQLSVACENAVQRGDSEQVELLTAQAWLLYLKGDLQGSIDKLGEAQLAKGEDDNSLKIGLQANFHCLQALVYLKRSEFGQCWFSAETTYGLLVKHPPTQYLSYFAYAFLPDVYTQLAKEKKDLEALSLTPKKILEKAEKAITFLRGFAIIFKWAETRVYTNTAALLIAKDPTKNLKKAIENWKKGTELAKKWEMVYDQALSMYNQATVTKDSSLHLEAERLCPEVKGRSATAKLRAFQSFRHLNIK